MDEVQRSTYIDHRTRIFGRELPPASADHARTLAAQQWYGSLVREDDVRFLGFIGQLHATNPQLSPVRKFYARGASSSS